ncbi:hypothetical protein B0H16DRAFT_1603030, partial [Mycena metata]
LCAPASRRVLLTGGNGVVRKLVIIVLCAVTLTFRLELFTNLPKSTPAGGNGVVRDLSVTPSSVYQHPAEYHQPVATASCGNPVSVIISGVASYISIQFD